jgi:hypothetical protein
LDEFTGRWEAIVLFALVSVAREDGNTTGVGRYTGFLDIILPEDIDIQESGM